jgi:hypothetical protein
MSYPQYPYRPYPPQNGIGTAGFVCGLIAVALGAIPYFGVYGIPAAICGIVLCAVGLGRVSQGRADNKAMTVTGLILSVLALPLILFFWFYLLVFHR